ncbi:MULTISPECIES: hypothetical protein [unclassified Herbaspirillum]|uniref:hypothetical protein n=1 Tax=unclassified Herbaspirillum TaxID=2624150 RepID=UPI000E2E9AC8|nr:MULTISPECIES: hypothetical protein [unclassified Herbaspirillum]RFB73806.1 hypothetical protein DZB54_05900 [Herbaspirillum sp. 3R-3a1]TFI10383.1 hypothetical protein E4P32_02270 [Herbaspirillum sp. 3R11]TFI16288.1 hypothetical protein E4P31_02275 [Herbaspirillum sp. 3R-11]TFI21692.1 hypothetical protein E4P30_20335 [Herbaspirillum sp. 3C11]
MKKKSNPMDDYRPLMDVFTCVRPLLAKNDHADFPFSVLGTCFIADFYGRYFVVTATHTYARSHGVMQLTAQYDPQRDEMLPISRRFELIANDESEEELSDITILEIDAEKVDVTLLAEHYPAKISVDDTVTILNPNFNYTFRGYPHELREYSGKQIHTVGVIADAFLIEGGETGSGLHGLEVNNATDFPSFDGFSGSPVFQLSHMDDTVTFPCFSGMLIRGSQSAGIVHFITCKHIVRALQTIVKENDIPPLKLPLPVSK